VGVVGLVLVVGVGVGDAIVVGGVKDGTESWGGERREEIRGGSVGERVDGLES